jgi:hypothetical protein
MWASIAIAFVNMALALVLVVVYARVYTRARAPFTLGLIVFAMAFLAQNVLTAYAYGTMMPIIPADFAPLLLGIGILEAGGLGAIVWTASR